MRTTATSRLTTATLIVMLAGLVLPAALQATEFQISRLAAELNRASSQLAHELRNARGYGSLQFSAERLGREAGQLVDAIRRNRSHSYLSSQFNDISRHYQDLETSFLRANGGQHSRYLYNQVSLISNVFAGLHAQFQYGGFGYPSPYGYGHPPVVNKRIIINPPIHKQPRQQQRRDRRDYGSISAQRPLQFNHGSSVLDRQFRQEQSRRRVESIVERRHGDNRRSHRQD